MKKIILLTSFLSITGIIVLSDLNVTTANSALPNNGTAGAPADNGGLTCANCHASTVTQTTGVISSNIPASGFINGTTYSVSVTMSGASAYGFELTPQTATSNVGIGTWIAGTGSGVSGKYIKQSAKKTGASAVWTFSWTAPATGTTVTFYGAFNYANNNNNSSGDIIKTSSVTYLANTTGIQENDSPVTVSVFPNPASEFLNLTSSELFCKGMIYNTDGKLVKTISEQELVSKSILLSELSSGMYFLHISTEKGKTHTSKFLKK